MLFPLLETLYTLQEKKNPIASKIYDKWNIIETDPDKSDDVIKSIIDDPISPSPTKIDISNYSSIRGLDLRIRGVFVSGFRSIPAGDKLYGINLEYVPETPCSYVILGDNGSGKTSLYSAIEYNCLGATAIAEKHKIQPDEEQRFYSYLNDISNKIIIEVKYNDQHFNPSSLGTRPLTEFVDLRPFFCSESDISIFECSGNPIVKYVDNLLGLEDLNIFLDLLNTLKNELRTRQEGIPEGENSIRRNQLENWNKNTVDAIELCQSKIKEIRNDGLSRAQKVLKRMVQEYIEDEDPIELSYEIIESGETLFDGQLQLKNDNKKKIEPRHYFNNFRFKLYIISLRIAMAMQIMNTYKISFPILFDDIFDSSDFKNRLSTKQLFQKIFSVYEDEVDIGRPLQLIFFTQDEVIANSAYMGINTKKNGKVQRCSRLARIFSHNEAIEATFKPGDNFQPTFDTQLEYHELTALIKESNI